MICSITEKPVLVQNLGTLNENNGYIDFDFDSTKSLRFVVIEEDIAFSQRVEVFELFVKKQNGRFKKVYSGTVIGSKKIISLKGVKANGVRFLIKQSRSNPIIKSIGFYE